MASPNGPLRVGIGGPVGAGKTTLTAALCAALRDRLSMAVVTNDIYTREDASITLAAIAELTAAFPDLDLVLIESGGDNLSATFSPELADVTIYVIDTAAGEEIPRKGGPAITRSDILVINKTDLAPHVGASLEVMERDATRMRAGRPFVFAQIRHGKGVDEIVSLLARIGGLPLPLAAE